MIKPDLLSENASHTFTIKAAKITGLKKRIVDSC